MCHTFPSNSPQSLKTFGFDDININEMIEKFDINQCYSSIFSPLPQETMFPPFTEINIL